MRTGLALGYDGLPRIGGGRRFWAELTDAVEKKIYEGLEHTLDATDELIVGSSARDAILFLRLQLKHALVHGMNDLKKDADAERSVLRRRGKLVLDAGIAQSRRAVRDAFKTLNLDERSTTLADVKKNYKRLANKYHPDRDPATRDLFVECSEAYQVLRRHFASKDSR